MEDIDEILKNCESENERKLILIGCGSENAKLIADKIKGTIILIEEITMFARPIESITEKLKTFCDSIENTNDAFKNLNDDLREIKIDQQEKRKQNRKNWHWKGKGK